MAEHPLNLINKIDPDFFNHIAHSNRFVFSDGALPRKYKLLIALAFDAAHGADQGVKSLARESLQAGATREEIGESLRVAYFLSGVGSIYTASQALNEIF